MFCLGYDMSTFIRRYGRYMNEKAFAYRQMAFDFTRVKKGYVRVLLAIQYFNSFTCSYFTYPMRVRCVLSVLKV